MRAYLSLGANLGDRAATLDRALRELDAPPGVSLTAVSPIYETEPHGVTEQPGFLNLAVQVETEYEPLELLAALKDIEYRLGRRPTFRWGPRVIDIDIVLFEDRVSRSETLTIPHPDYRNRAFVLVPLRDIASDVMDPETDETIAELAARFDGCGEVRRVEH